LFSRTATSNFKYPPVTEQNLSSMPRLPIWPDSRQINYSPYPDCPDWRIINTRGGVRCYVRRLFLICNFNTCYMLHYMFLGLLIVSIAIGNKLVKILND
jgi:hypothetical protein